MHSNMPARADSLPRTMIKMLVGSILPSLVIGDEKEVAKVYPMGPIFKDLLMESGYFHLQATRPDTVGEHVKRTRSCPITQHIHFYDTRIFKVVATVHYWF